MKLDNTLRGCSLLLKSLIFQETTAGPFSKHSLTAKARATGLLLPGTTKTFTRPRLDQLQFLLNTPEDFPDTIHSKVPSQSSISKHYARCPACLRWARRLLTSRGGAFCDEDQRRFKDRAVGLGPDDQASSVAGEIKQDATEWEWQAESACKVIQARVKGSIPTQEPRAELSFDLSSAARPQWPALLPAEWCNSL